MKVLNNKQQYCEKKIFIKAKDSFWKDSIFKLKTQIFNISILLFILLQSSLATSAEIKWPVSDFAATGLLVDEREPMVDILIRAHQGNAQAIVLVITGYAKGVGGFPKSEDLANAWEQQLSFLGADESQAFVNLLLFENREARPDLFHYMLSYCTVARNNALPEKFKNAGLFDMEKMCLRLEGERRQHPEWLKNYEKALTKFSEETAAFRMGRTLMRDLRTRAATSEDKLQLLFLRQEAMLSDELLLFFAATTHNPDKEAPDWNEGRVEAFFHMQKNTGNHGIKNEASISFLQLLSVDKRNLVTRFSEKPVRVWKEMVKAHMGVPESCREMAVYYTQGRYGFPKDINIASCWLFNAASRADFESTLSLSEAYLRSGDPVEAWAWADLAQDIDNVGFFQRRRAQNTLDEVKCNLSSSQLEEAKKRQTQIMEKVQVWLGSTRELVEKLDWQE